MPKVLIIDHYDSFTYNLQQYCKSLGYDLEIRKCDDPKLGNLGTWELENDRTNYSHIIFSPGPGSVYKKEDIGHSAIVLQNLRAKIPMLGVCLGHQLMAHLDGAGITPIMPYHGKNEFILIQDKSGLFQSLPSKFEAIRYHSQAITPEDAILLQQKGWQITAQAESDKTIMAMEHPDDHLYGVQFHPESIGTPHGLKILENFLSLKNQNLHKKLAP